jgi:DNA-binding CsgD family transcriptional regulator
VSRTPTVNEARQPALGGRWPLVGRESELGRLRTLITGIARGVVLAGPAGVGKTRLSLELVELARLADTTIIQVGATRAASSLPLGAFAPFLPTMTPGEVVPAENRIELLQRCARAIVATARGHRLLLVVDDAHLLDDTSATLVQQLVAVEGAIVVATLRDDEATPDPIVALWKDNGVERMEVGGLDAVTVEQLLAAVLGGPVDPAAAARFTEASEGKVLFLRELVIGAVRDRSLMREAGLWYLSGPLRPSTRLAQLVEARLADLTEPERRLLEIVSLGEPLGMVELSLIGDADLAEELERKGLLTSGTDGRRLQIRLAHPIYGEVVRASTPAIRLRQLARALADAVEATGARRREDTLRIAVWRLDGGGGKPELMLAAAVIARWRYDFPLAEKLAKAALQAGPNFDAALLTAQLAFLQGRSSEAATRLHELMKDAENDRQRHLAATTHIDVLALQVGDIDLGMRIAEEAESLIEDPGYRDELAARRVAMAGATQGPRLSVVAAEPLLRRATGRALVQVAISASWALGRLGQLAEAERVAERGLNACSTLPDKYDWYPWTHTFFRAEAWAHRGWLDKSYRLSSDQYEQGIRDQSQEAQAWFAWQLTKTTADRGFPRTAEVHGRAAVALFRALGRPQFEHFALGSLGTALALTGQAAEAKETLDALDALDLHALYWASDVMQTRAWIAAVTGDIPAAVTVLEEASELAASIGDLIGQATALHAMARLGHPHDAVVRLRSLASTVEGQLVSTRAAHAQALAGGNADALENASSDFEQMGAILLAAEASADAAVVHRKSADDRRAVRAENRSGLLAERCENPATPALQAIEGRVRLTRAEREVALLAASGQTSKQIAEQLVVSRRTVENQLQHVYVKLGISGRRDLAATLREIS